jgi:hypothetical protein
MSETGTSLFAGQTLSTSEDKWLPKLAAEQKLFGDVAVSGSVGKTAQGMINKSISAGIKKSWQLPLFWSPPPPPRSPGMIDLRRNLAAMRSNSIALIGAACNFIVRGTPRSQ